MNKLFDLRFVIGCFFLIIGILLILHGFISSESDQTVNRWCGAFFSLFGLVMLLLSYRSTTNGPNE
ncbi:MAG: hypothetical protein LC128_12150 [Chitinophagales bacterium]|nr:hypothetical protein [Chitinophagales bacterium]